jgi:hypothetical protein
MITYFVLWCYLLIQGMAQIHRSSAFSKRWGVTCWVEELPSVLWSLRTTPNRSVGFTPFFLVYGAEAVLPTDIEFHAPRVV